MRFKTKYLLTLLLVAVLLPGISYSQSAKITWDVWGVPHITANNEGDLFFAQGWAEMQSHANLVLKMYGRARGKAAAYWGPAFVPSDQLVHRFNFPAIAVKFSKSQDPELKLMIRSFTDGMNAYVKAHPEAVADENKAVLPVTSDDVNLQGLYVFVTRFTAGLDLGLVANWKEAGSNAIAIAPKRSASGNAMLVQNPHLPWADEFTFFESELTLKGTPIYGAELVGIPGISIGFNEDLGWTHTNNTLDNADSFVLTLTDGGYLLDGKNVPFKERPDTIWVKQADGKLSPQYSKCYSSVQGPVLKMGDKKAIALKAAGMDSPNTILEWWKMANSHDFNHFEAALKTLQIPFWNVLYADKKGNIFYLFNGQVPRRPFGNFSDWQLMVKGDSSKYIWKSYLSYDELPKLKNPASGWLQNSNDPPWTVTLPRELDKNRYPAYIAPDVMPLRSQRAVNMLMADSSITFDHLVDYKLSTHVELADRLLDDLLAAIDTTSSPILWEAKQVLAKWDRKSDGDSRGMTLFYAWAMQTNIDYTTPWDRNNPNTTPSGLNNIQESVKSLERVSAQIKSAFGSLSVPWGDYLRVRANGVDLPANGAREWLGVFRVASGNPGSKTETVNTGDSWVGVIEFGKTVRAKVLMSYGNSSQKQSVHNGDQLKFFSEKKLRDAWFYPQDLAGHIEYTEVKKGDTFIKE
ncbi:acyl-homoserine-lactone acylase [Mucilaginibacter gossypiicola]|uniref:Acyl-homoserine-lactone acylase n=1 Tax=Mucilaginibacter gossypiicola TaxID=551995 RepID=A0A1H8BP36_9SPHI|nr:penicillin acylase family protein [Mucilaginibacter gossypiicola]SEM84605.1 acyl-homoserine-lactone acylase [Mucilaginibacter gossypiicola]